MAPNMDRRTFIGAAVAACLAPAAAVAGPRMIPVHYMADGPGNGYVEKYTTYEPGENRYHIEEWKYGGCKNTGARLYLTVDASAWDIK